MRQKSVVLLVATVLLLSNPLVSVTVLAAPPAPPALTTLEPGGFRDIAQNLTINVVFVGYEQGIGPADIDQAAFLAGLPETYRAVNRFPSFYRGNEFMGLTFSYDYNLVYADPAFEDAFFGYLGSIAVPQPLTLYQEQYNGQAARSLDVTGNAWIDAPSVEQWLADNAGLMLGIDTSRYTVFFVNWWGRPDFQFHVYTKTDEPDPDTGVNVGVLYHSRKIIAWGGSTPDDEENGLGNLHRLWFYDLSAGPEAWSDNWDLDDADVDGDGVLDYRMPPVWEYGNLAAYRPFDDLSGDLGKVLRYVAIDMLFTTSPLYKPAISPPALPQALQIDLNMIQANPDFDGLAWLTPDLVAQELGELQPLNTIEVEVNSIPYDGRLADVFDCFVSGSSCFGNRMWGIAFADLFLYFEDHLMQYLEGDADYEVPVFAFNHTDDMSAGYLGFADDNWVDGTQSFIFGFDSPSSYSSGWGWTNTVIHEVGHHLGMSHPHDGFDYESSIDFWASGDTHFAWSGDESSTVMSYLHLDMDFGQFDRDNMSRYLTSADINQSNAILKSIYERPRAGQVSSLLLSADAHATAALTAYDGFDWAGAAFHAQMAYGDVLAAAAQIEVPVEPQSWQADYKAKGLSGRFIDEVDYHLTAP